MSGAYVDGPFALLSIGAEARRCSSSMGWPPYTALNSSHLKRDGCWVRGLAYLIVTSSGRIIQPPASVGTEMWAKHVVQSTDPYSTSIPPFPLARLP